MNTIGSAFLKRAAGLALAARIHLRRRIGAIDGFREYSCRGRLTHSARAAEKIGVGQLASDYGINICEPPTVNNLKFDISIGLKETKER